MSTNIEVGRALSRPVQERGGSLLAIKEDQWFDRKDTKISALSLASAEVGFANADGGTIVVGLHNGEVQGTDALADHRNGLIQAAIDFTMPTVRAHWKLVGCLNESGEADQLLIIDVEPSEQVHANQKDEVYLRVGDENRKLNFRQRQELTFDKGQAVFESTILSNASIRNLNSSLLKSYADALEHPDRIRLLCARSLLGPKKEVTAAAMLLFGDQPQIHFPEAYVRVLRYRGTEPGTGSRQQLVFDTKFEGPIPDILLEAADEIRRLQPRRRALGTRNRFEQVPVIPEDAWLEGLVNAAIHRSYSLGGDHIRVELFDDRIEIESPGRFPGLISISTPLNATRFARNPRIARVCSDLNFGQELGEGIRRMFEEMRQAGLADPLYKQTAGSVQLTLLALPVDQEMAALLPDGSQPIVALLRRYGALGTGEIAEFMAISRPSALRRLHALQEAGLVDWFGKSPKDPRAVWSAD